MADDLLDARVLMARVVHSPPLVVTSLAVAESAHLGYSPTVLVFGPMPQDAWPMTDLVLACPADHLDYSHWKSNCEEDEW